MIGGIERAFSPERGRDMLFAHTPPLSARTLDGLVLDMPIALYHGDQDSISKTGLDDVHRSPFHYHALHLNELRPPRKDRPGQLEGTLAHCAILEPDKFLERFEIGPNANKNTRVWKDFEESLGYGVIGIKPEQYDVAFAQAESVMRLPDVAAVMAVGESEVSCFWRDPRSGAQCRVRPDRFHPIGSNACVLLDVKTFKTSEAAAFARQAKTKRYHVQDAFYSDVVAGATGLEVLAFLFVVVESEWPFAASIVCLDEPSKDLGRTEYRADLDTYAECVRSNTWPPASQAVQVVSLPAWSFYED